ncbi:MAG TPA: Flp family type IVb pilin [Polyangiaceae bacterium]|jgi:Flp pilus assembly pilin Flp|nr:Flp family type IVb pilin [Polyangiaceae bacterium]
MSRNIKRRFGSFFRDTRGITTVEYAIVLALVAIAGVAIWQKFGTTLVTAVGNSNTSMNNVVMPATTATAGGG